MNNKIHGKKIKIDFITWILHKLYLRRSVSDSKQEKTAIYKSEK